MITLRSISHFRRNFSSKPVRVRFAPSPTGFLHLGGLRTALYNCLFAMSKQGRMILRIEDTDQSRKVDGAMEALIKDLEWAGIYCHEGPTQGGSHGPYIQSQRIDIYKKHVDALISNGSAYPCFCTDKRLNLLRREAVKMQQIPKYDNKCRNLSADDVKQKIATGNPYCIRFKLTPDCKYFDDIIFGSIAYDVTLTEGDPVILKSDGFPTYHLANVVDDHLMEISHVLRGVEWQISTTKHILMYRAFGWTPPVYGHLPLILNADGTKLSKRQDGIRVDEYRKKHVLPLSLINYMTIAGGGFGHVIGEGVQIHTMEELSEKFHLDQVNCNSTKLNPDLLRECNRLEMIRQLSSTDSLNKMVDSVRVMVEEKFKDKPLEISTDHINHTLTWSSGRITSLDELVSPSLAFLWVLPNQQKELDDSTETNLLSLLKVLERTDQFEMDAIKKTLLHFTEENGVKYSKFMKVLRSVLSGLSEGPSVAEMMFVLGKNNTLQRIQNAVQK